jgi:hypothetical protein
LVLDAGHDFRVCEEQVQEGSRGRVAVVGVVGRGEVAVEELGEGKFGEVSHRAK